MHHPQVVQSPIINDILKVKNDGHTELKLVPKTNCRWLSENFITILLAKQTMVDSKKQEINKIIFSSVILHYVHYCRPNF